MCAFKLIAIRPEKECGKKFRKLLEPGRLYQFCNEYDFYVGEKILDDDADGVIDGYKKRERLPSELYKVGNLHINITAIVGKNGSGKSTLIELLLYGIYQIGRKTQDKNTGKDILPTYTESLEAEIRSTENHISTLKKSIENFKGYIDSYLKRLSKTQTSKRYFQSRIFGYINEIQDLNVHLDSAESKSRYLKAELVLSNELDDSVKDTFYDCSIFYEVDDILYEVRINSKLERRIIKNLDHKNDTLPIEKDFLDSFFYSMILNYSHHSLNPQNIGYWINSLFHKNDGYKTPAVINPMREDGIIPIDNEVKLAKDRLITNLAFQKLNTRAGEAMLTDKQYVKFITLSPRSQINENNISFDFDPQSQTFKPRSKSVIVINMIMDICARHPILESLIINGVDEEEKKWVERTLQYLLYKVKKIQKLYPEYVVDVSPKTSSETDQILENRKTINLLLEDYSHVSYKFHQAIFFLKKLIEKTWDKELILEDEVYKITPNGLLRWMNITDDQNRIIEFDFSRIFGRIPPAIFNVDFELSELNEKNDSTRLNELSSGEQQKIHLINAFIYHFNNTFSVHKESSGKRQKYRYFNVIFDEIELYFHPEYQRSFINDLLGTLAYYKHLTEAKEIKALNILFSTHSPFILSDIPSDNILKINIGKPSSDSNGINSFAANIHDLLDDEFFLDKGSMGEFAKLKINETINFLTYWINQREIYLLQTSNELLEYQNKKLDALIAENEYIESLVPIHFDKIVQHKKIIDIIGEPVLQTKLQEMYNMISEGYA